MSTPKERPVLFKGEMVRAILEGQKTQTRRIVKPPWKIVVHDNGQALTGNGWLSELDNPYGQSGDRLWVRETFAIHPEDGSKIYRADRGGDYQGAAQGDFKWKPSIFMPRWASRLTLEIVRVRVERLQDISEEDAKAEGVDACRWCEMKDGSPCYTETYKELWTQINGCDSWDKNPWVFVIGFKRVIG